MFFWQDVQEISKDNHIPLENSWSALPHYTKPIMRIYPFLQGMGQNMCPGAASGINLAWPFIYITCSPLKFILHVESNKTCLTSILTLP